MIVITEALNSPQGLEKKMGFSPGKRPFTSQTQKIIVSKVGAQRYQNRSGSRQRSTSSRR